MPPPRIPSHALLLYTGFPRPSSSLQPQSRTFTTSTPQCANLRTKTFKPPRALSSLPTSTPPPYPYGSPQWYKQQRSGLYGGQTIQFGHNVSEKNEIKTPRSWLPNMKYKYLYSEALDKRIRVKLSTRVLRTIDKVGGLDEYVIGTGSGRLRELGTYGWGLRWVVLQKMEEKGALAGREELRREVEKDRGISAKALEERAVEDEGEESELDSEGHQGVREDLTDEEQGGMYAEQLQQEHMEEMPPPVEEKPGLMTRLGRGLRRPFGRS